MKLSMRNVGIVLLLVILASNLFNPGMAQVSRSIWDIHKLPDLDTGKSRALFGYTAPTTIQDDYSWKTVLPENDKSFQMILPPCSLTPTRDNFTNSCIENFRYKRVTDKDWSSAKLGKVQLGVDTTTNRKGEIIVGTIAADAEWGHPAGGKMSIWSLNNAAHAGGVSYAVRARFMGDNNMSQEVSINKFKLEIFPVSFSDSADEVTQDQLVYQEFPDNFEYSINLQLGKFVQELTGWYFGRIKTPLLKQDSISGTFEVQGKPALIPIGITNVVNNQIAEQYVNPEWCQLIKKERNLEFCTEVNRLYDKAFSYSLYEGWSMEHFSRWESAVGGIRTAVTLSEWSLTSSFFGNSRVAKTGCALESNQKVPGFRGAIFSNATLMQLTAPDWDQASQAFSFRVSSPHLDELGKKNLGFYTLYLPVEFARCLWGDSVAGARAEIRIVSDKGEESVTSVIFTEEQGNLRFHIEGFSYSSPTISVKIHNSNVKMEQKTNLLGKKFSKQSSLICVKGKKITKIIGTSGKCPKGFKIK